MEKTVTAIFDIGKTNKKFFLFDGRYNEVYKTYEQFDEIKDEDGHPTDDLKAIENWVKTQLSQTLSDKKYSIKRINFSTYGASFVHIDKQGAPIAPLYNYTKPYPQDLLDQFHAKYGDPLTIAKETASPPSGMLNSGMQLYWLKYARPQVFQQIKYSLHLPQYLSFLFTGIPLSDFTSIGCHTGLWHYEKGDYHDWVYAEGLDNILAPIVPTTTSINTDYEGHPISIGIGIHDSSAALLPYLKSDRNPFLLLSTGTWSIALNPYSDEILSADDLQSDCLNYMQLNGQAVKAARLFLGHEYSLQVRQLHDFFKKEEGYHRSVQFDEKLYARLKESNKPFFKFESIQLQRPQPEASQWQTFSSFEAAYHQLMLELMGLQIQSAQKAMGKSPIKKIYVDGGFADNDIFVKLLSYHFKGHKLRTTQSPLGSAIGAAMVIDDKKPGKKFLKKHYALKKHLPLTFDK
ncbi:MAG: FGGY family carbohydrate kinase [Saprospiraceae bacterium]